MPFSESFHTGPAVLLAAVALDLLLGDPPRWPHPVRLIGAAIDVYEQGARRMFSGRAGLFCAGLLLAAGLPVLVWGACVLLLAGAERVHPWLGFGVAVYAAYTCISITGLTRAVRRVGAALAAGDLAAARSAVAHIVGRDPHGLAPRQVAAAAVESAAENASDGIIAPLFYLVIGGPALGMAYKAVNTADSMIGYRNERYEYFGKAAARVDDLANWLPARLTGLFITGAAWLLGHSARRAWRTARADARRHSSPNAGWPEAAMAGALGISLGGPATYGGVRHERAALGASGGAPQALHVGQAVHLVRAACLLAVLLAVVLAGMAA